MSVPKMQSLQKKAIDTEAIDLSGIEHVAHIYQMAYCSVLSQPLDEAALASLVAEAEENNARRNITGTMMIDQGLVIQWLEGAKSDVRALWAKLLEDKRHQCIVELMHRNFADERLFPDWAMQRASRQDMLNIIHGARERAQQGIPTAWANALSSLCTLLDPDNAKTYDAALPASDLPAKKIQ
jgi:Sensors of blue-light using FAD